IKNILVEVLANLEASFEFSHQEIEIGSEKQLIKNLKEAAGKLEELIRSAETGCILREGIVTVICGKPNVGKSSLMNAFLREDKVIVTPVAGTTRDAIEEIINIKGIPIKIVDTAGIIEPRDLVEREGIIRSHRYLNRADLVLFMVDNSRSLNKEDFQIMDKIREKPVIVVINKIDLNGRLDFEKIENFLKGRKIVRICAIKEEGIPQLEDSIRQQVLGGKMIIDKESVLVTNTRHKNFLEESLKFVNTAVRNFEERIGGELIVEDIKDALKSMGYIVGGVTPDEVLNRIFEEFCVGK
ncbi:MAG: 50S ribosome-binding GTPase, partial [Thermoplasmatales archaeon]